LQEREAQELSSLDRLIAAARKLATEVKERTVSVAPNAAERMSSFVDGSSGRGSSMPMGFAALELGTSKERCPTSQHPRRRMRN